MRNELEIHAYLDKKNNNNITLEGNTFYGKKFANCQTKLFRIAGETGDTNIKINVDIEEYFDYIAKHVPEKFRTNRIKEWLNSANKKDN